MNKSNGEAQNIRTSPPPNLDYGRLKYVKTKDAKALHRLLWVG